MSDSAAKARLDAVTVHALSRPDDGDLIHAELRRGDAVVIVEQAATGQHTAPVIEGATVCAPYISVTSDDEIDRLHQTAVDLGATSWHALGSHPMGQLSMRVDGPPRGHQWSFGTYVPGQTW